MKKRTRPRTLTRMRSKSGSPPTIGKDSRYKKKLLNKLDISKINSFLNQYTNLIIFNIRRTFQEKRVSPSTTPITPVLSGIYNAEHSISLPPISNNFSTVNKTASNGMLLQLPR